VNYLIPVSCAVLCLVAQMPAAFADISVKTEKESYYFGEYLTFTITVDSVTGEPAFIYIIDEQNKSSSPIPIPVLDIVTEERSRFPFEKETYPQGRWTIRAHYGNATDQAEFTLSDSGLLVIPVWKKDVGRLWVNGVIDDMQYMNTITKELDEDVVSGNAERGGAMHVPVWVRGLTALWIQELVQDHEYALALEYMLSHDIIMIGAAE